MAAIQSGNQDFITFGQYKANTIKNLINWINAPKDEALINRLSKQLLEDKQRKLPRKMSQAVKKQIARIGKIPENQREFLKQLLSDHSKLRDTVFADTVIQTAHNIRQQKINEHHGITSNTMMPNARRKVSNMRMNATNRSLSPKAPNPTLTMNNQSNHNVQSHQALQQQQPQNTVNLSPFQVPFANQLINAYKVNETKIQQQNKQMEATKKKLEVLQNMNMHHVMQPTRNHLERVENQRNGFLFRGQTLAKMMAKIRKQEAKILNSNKQYSMEAILNQLIAGKTKTKQKYLMQLESVTKQQEEIRKEIEAIASDVMNMDIEQMTAKQAQCKALDAQKLPMQQNVMSMESFINGIRLLSGELIHGKEIGISSWTELATANLKRTESAELPHSPSMSSVAHSNAPQTAPRPASIPNPSFKSTPIPTAPTAPSARTRTLPSQRAVSPLTKAALQRHNRVSTVPTHSRSVAGSIAPSVVRSVAPSVTRSVARSERVNFRGRSIKAIPSDQVSVPQNISFAPKPAPKRKIKRAVRSRRAKVKSVQNTQSRPLPNLPPTSSLSKMSPMSTASTIRTQPVIPTISLPKPIQKPKDIGISLADVLPQRLIPIKLGNHFWSNGFLRDETQCIFDRASSKNREQWRKEYNQHIKAITARMKAMNGTKVNFKEIEDESIGSNVALNGAKPIVPAPTGLASTTNSKPAVHPISTNESNIKSIVNTPVTPPPSRSGQRSGNVNAVTPVTGVAVSTFNLADIPSPNIRLNLEETPQKRTIDELDNNGDEDSCPPKRLKLDSEVVQNEDNSETVVNNAENEEDADCINDLSEDEESPVIQRGSNQIVLSQPSTGDTDADTLPVTIQVPSSVTERRNNKETLNPRAGQNHPFKAHHQRRHRVKTGEQNASNKKGNRNNGEGQRIDKNHPLFLNDPMRKVENTKPEIGSCSHWVQKGWCGLIADGKCKFKHPERFDAKHFLCPDQTFRRTGQCGRAKCSFGHNRKEFPCRHYHEGRCTRNPCTFSHDWTPQRYQQWIDTKQIKDEARKEWREQVAERDRRNAQKMNQGNGHGAGGSMVTQNDARLNAVSSNTNFNSALTE